MGRRKSIDNPSLIETPEATGEVEQSASTVVEETVEVTAQDAAINEDGQEMEIALEAEVIAEKVSASPPEVQLAVSTLSGDIRDAVLERLRHEQDKRPWTERSEREQKNTAAAIDNFATNLVLEAGMIIAGEGQTTITARIDSVTVKGDIKAVVVVARDDPSRLALYESQGAKVLMVVVQSDKHIGERAPVHINPDQGELITEPPATEPAAEQTEVVVDETEEVVEEAPSDVTIGGMPVGLVNGRGEPIEHAAA